LKQLKRRPVCLAITIIALAACNRAESPKPTPVTERYRLAADAAALPLLRALANAYTAANPYTELTVEQTSQASLAGALQSGQATLAATALAPPPPTPTSLWWQADLALDGVSMIVNSQNPIGDITTRDARDVFAGIRNQWEQLGVNSIGAIKVAVREDGDGSRAVFDQLVMGDQPLTLDALVMPSAETMMNYVALNPEAVGYAPSARASAQSGVKALALDGKTATPATLGSGEYPLSRTISLIGAREPQSELRNFVAWALGPQGKQITESLGYASLN
jgi:phosphate transport system substrate-binding protein